MAATGRRREFAAGGTVGKIGRGQPRRAPEHLILQGRRQDDVLRVAQGHVDAEKKVQVRRKWEASSERRQMANQVKQRTKQLIEEEASDVKRRRQLLRSLFAQDEREYAAEIAASAETPLERQARMRERVRSLREHREQERQEIAQRKYDEQFKANCDDLRPLRAAAERDALEEQRRVQLDQLEWKRDREQQVQTLYDDLWQQDIEAKKQREETERQRRAEANRATAAYVRQQADEAREAREAERRARDEEATLRREQAEMERQEEQRQQALRRAKKQQMQRSLVHLNERQRRERERQMQEEMALDMKLLDDVLRAQADDGAAAAQQRQRVRREAEEYRDYIKECRRRQQEREQMLDRLRHEEIEREFEKRAAKWDAEANARKRLMEDVYATRQAQVQEKLDRAEQERLEKEQLVAELEAQAEQGLAEERAKSDDIRNANKQYRQQLQGQIDERVSEREAIARREREADEQFRAQEQAKLDRISAEMTRFSVTGKATQRALRASQRERPF